MGATAFWANWLSFKVETKEQQSNQGLPKKQVLMDRRLDKSVKIGLAGSLRLPSGFALSFGFLKTHPIQNNAHLLQKGTAYL
jgi:hypothetical protein